MRIPTGGPVEHWKRVCKGSSLSFIRLPRTAFGSLSRLIDSLAEGTRSAISRADRPANRKLWSSLLISLAILALIVSSKIDPGLGRSLGPVSVYAQAEPSLSGVYTYHYDNQRTGENTSETLLTPANVNASTFGKLFSDSVDGQIYTQPLYVAGVTVGGATHNVVYVATENDTVYAFDADAGGTPLWQTSLLPAGATPIPIPFGCDVIVPTVGITPTPVIDPATGAIFVLAQSRENGTDVHRLHGLDIATGAERANSPVVITASFPGSGGTTVTFNPQQQLDRPALLLANNTVYLASASYCDAEPYSGWVLGYDKSSLSQVAVFNDTPDGSEGGIWMAGGGASSDQNGNVYVTTGNGTFDANLGGPDYGDSFLKLTPTLSVSDYFTPSNQAQLSASDNDLGSSALVLLPDQTGPNGQTVHLAVSAGKAGTIYLVNRDKMGGFNSTDQVVDEISGQILGLYDTPAYFNGNVYFVAVGDVPKAFSLSNGTFSSTPSQTGSITFAYSGASPIVSANGTSDAVVWAIENASNVAVLHAFGANNLATELYGSEQNPARDHAGTYVKFTPPTVVNGKVYVPTASALVAFGLLANPTAGACSVAITSPVNNATVSGTINVAASASGCASGDYAKWYLPDGANKYTGAFQFDTTKVANGASGFSVQILNQNGGVDATASASMTIANEVATP